MESIRTAYWVCATSADTQTRNQQYTLGMTDRLCQRSAQSPSLGCLVADLSDQVPSVCGIKTIWVAPGSRRQGIASMLVDAARCNCIAGYVVPRNEVAFLDPTDSGRLLAAAYTGSP
eukprot:scaffold681920_cov50-Prasinocladus_malaysianus.AAC.1